MSERGKLGLGEIVDGRYRIDAVLGEGGMGTVYRATHTTLRTPVVIKILHPQYSLDDEYRIRFVREARVTASLKHPNAVQIIDFGQFGDILYIAMELLQGPSLREVQRHYGRELTYAHIHHYAEALADVLRVAHGLSLTHRDLKPENVIIEDAYSDHERPVVVDFGLAFIANAAADLGRMTETGIVVGTPLYVAPEQAEGLAVGPSADIYSLGCMFYELVAGKPPFLGRSTLQILNGHLFVPPTPLASVMRAPDVPTGFVHLVMAMLNKQPNARPVASEVVETLEMVAPHRRDRGRARGNMAIQERSERAVTLNPSPLLTVTAPLNAADQATLPASPQTATHGGVVAITTFVGIVDLEIDDELIHQFAANGVGVTERPDGQPGPSDSAIIDLHIDISRAAEHTAQGVPVVTAARADDSERLAGLIRAGAAEVVTLPVNSTELVRKTLRAVRKARRRKGGS